MFWFANKENIIIYCPTDGYINLRRC